MVLVFLVVLFISCFIGSLAFARWLFLRLANWEPLDRLMAASAPLVILILSALFLREFVSSPFRDQNSPLLTPTFALVQGYQIYYGLDSGPALGTPYGPVNSLSYLPATIASSPTMAIIIAEFLAITFYFLPILWLHIGEYWHKSYKLKIACYIFLLFCLFTINSSALKGPAFMIHADAPAMGLSAAACAVLYYRKRKDSIASLLLSSVLAVLAVWTKQVTVPLLVALPTYILLADGFRGAVRYILCLVVSSSLISTLLLSFFNTKALLFNMFTVPSQTPWIGFGSGAVKAWSLKGIVSLVFVAQNLLDRTLELWVIIAIYIGYQLLLSSEHKTSIREWLNHNRWFMLVIVSFYMMPISLLQLVKIGGNDNAYGYTVYFLLAAANLALIKAATESTSVYDQFTQTIAKLFVFVMVIGIALIQIPSISPIFVRLPNWGDNPQEVAYNYAKKHPGEAYFPWNPLSTFMAEGKLYHWSYKIYELEEANFKVSDERFREYIPANAKFVAFSSRLVLENTLQYLPDFSKQVTLDELPGWIVYARD